MRPSSKVGGFLFGAMAAAALPAQASVSKDAAVGVPFQRAPQPGVSTLCDACGGVGSVPFSRIRSRHASGQIVLLAPSASDLWTQNHESRLSKALERAGFTVRVVESERDLDRALNDTPADVVLADAADSARLRDRLANTAAAPLVLSVLPGVEAAATQAAQHCSVQISAKHNGESVKQIESYVSARQSGTATDCARSG
jgi:hypothetical protein